MTSACRSGRSLRSRRSAAAEVVPVGRSSVPLLLATAGRCRLGAFWVARSMASEIKVRAENLAGQALNLAPKHPPGPSPEIGSPGEPISEPPTLADQGINRKQSMSWQDMAAIPEPDFEAALASCKEQGIPATTKPLAKQGREHPPYELRRSSLSIVHVRSAGRASAYPTE